MKTKLIILMFAIIANIYCAHAAVVSGTCGGNLTWTLDTQVGTLIIEGTGSMSNWSPYSTGGSPWREYSSYISSVSLPEGITNIGNSAFQNCSSLTSIVIPNSVLDIGAFSFQNCSSLSSLSIPDMVTQIGQEAFKYCKNLTVINIPNGVTSIASQTFWGCNNLKYVNIGNGVASIGGSTFYGCTNIKVLTLGRGIKSLSYEAVRSSHIDTLIVLSSMPPSGGSGCGISNSAVLCVRRSCIDNYRNAAWWEDFSEINPIDDNTLVVKFVNWDGTVLSSEDVEEGASATPPANPTREGYTFIGWDKDFNNVTEDMTITALYKINRYKIEFIDWDNTVLKSDSVDWNTAAIAPSNPSRKGYTFKGWDKAFEHVASDMNIKALYEMGEETDIVVRYTNGNNGDIILRQSVIFKVPEAPDIEGFTFLGWKTVAAFIEDGVEIQAIYKSDTEAAPEVYVNPSNSSQKLIREGHVYILRGDKTYTLQGQEVK